MRYGHLVRGPFTEQERALVDVQLGDGKVLPLRPTVGGSGRKTHRHPTDFRASKRVELVEPAAAWRQCLIETMDLFDRDLPLR